MYEVKFPKIFYIPISLGGGGGGVLGKMCEPKSPKSQFWGGSVTVHKQVHRHHTEKIIRSALKRRCDYKKINFSTETRRILNA